MKRENFTVVAKSVLFCLLINLFSCKTTSINQLTGVAETLKIVCDNPSKYLFQEVHLQGTYLGWSGSNCNFVQNYAHQIMRSDWVFSDLDSNCIYVTGGKPDFLDPLRAEDVGKKIQLRAKLLKNNENKFYLEYISAYMSTTNN